MKDKNFTIIGAAQDTGGEAAAGKYYDRAKVTFPAVIDTHHVISTRYHLINVPMGVWIDEKGQMVRPPDVAFSRKVQFSSIKVDGDQYVAALRDWVEKGAKSKYVLPAEEFKARWGPRKGAEELAEVNFKLGLYFHENHQPALAKKYWQEAERLNPESWNYHRQDWSFSPKDEMGNFMKKFRALGEKDYYPPLKLP